MDNRKKVGVVGAGKIGQMIVALLAQRYDVTVYDQDFKAAKAAAGKNAHAVQVNAGNADALARHLKGNNLTVNACPLFMNLPIAKAAFKAHTSYIDLSEDVKT